ncbi:MAG: phenylalanine--tRNA ligase subunit alpha [Patescibacteria group bacterium]|nr:phenylalanine--tRNA ligase subunit alpha [Patescibacteria group bacterium]
MNMTSELSLANLNHLAEKYLERISLAKDISELEQVYQAAFSRKSGEISNIMHELKDLAPDKKKEIAPYAQDLRQKIETALANKKIQLGDVSQDQTFFDATVPSKDSGRGHIHPATQVIWEIEDFFRSLGFMILDGPEVDSTFFNFEGVNIPKDHPARDMQDTFYLDENIALRPHTSNCQVRAMREYGAPLRAIVPGRCYRNENRDARHEHTFLQFEGFMIDEGISIANFRDVIDQFFKRFINEKTETRIRPGYFPFVEPGFEFDFKCFCDGFCGLCKGTGWIEFGGAGMIHPNVLKHGHIDPDKFSGWAFGFGPERLAMIRKQIPDLRLFRSGDLRFLEQF